MDYKAYVEEKLKDHPKRLKHTLAVYNRAIEFGKLYNGNIEVLKVSSLLHDVTKHESDDFHIKTINDEKIINNYPKEIWHAFSGAKVAKSLKITDEKIIEAIKYHVFGKIDMNLETMILAVSDYCEETRTHKEAKEVYKLALKDLNKAYLYMAESIIKHLKSKNIEPLDEQVKTYLHYKKKEEDK